MYTAGRYARLAFLPIVAIALTAASIRSQAGNSNHRVTDQGITDAVERSLERDSSVTSHLIDVGTVRGVVTLSGTVDNLLAKDRALEIAQSIQGVRSVTDRLHVKPVHRSDSEIRKDIEQALLLDPVTDSFKTDVEVKDGIVILTGRIQSWQEKEIAADVARRIKGVKGIENELRVEYPMTRSDSEIKKDIQSALRSSVWLPNGGGIEVEVKNGVATLAGEVRSALGKEKARRAAWVIGVTRVDDSNLEVNPSAARTLDQRPRTLTDQEIKQAITDAFLFDPRVYSFQPRIEVKDGVLTLRGAVDNLKARRAAEANARNTVGVRRVRNHLKVRTENPPGDAEIASSIEKAFVRDPYVENNEITVSVINGKAYLTGRVDSSFERWQADDVASRVKGVIDVQNNLAVEPRFVWRAYGWPYYSHHYYPYSSASRWETDRDVEIQEDIEGELFWSPFVDANEVTVTVDDGVATLTGTVDSWSERAAATENAYEGGATMVKNELKVE